MLNVGPVILDMVPVRQMAIVRVCQGLLICVCYIKQKREKGTAYFCSSTCTDLKTKTKKRWEHSPETKLNEL